MTGLYFYRYGGFPPASKYLDKIWHDQNHKKHKKRLKNVKGQLDLTPPRNNMHLQIQLNKLHMEQERQAAIDKQNLVIIEKLTEIKKSPGRIDHINKTWKPSNDRMKRFRARRQRRIEQENRLMEERLKKVQSYYDTDDWEKDYKKHLYYISMMENTTKDYDSVEYKDIEPEKSSEGNSDEDKDDTDSLPPVPPGTPERDKKDKKSSDEEDNISLPPIDNKQGKKKACKKDEGYSEQDAIMDAEELRAAIKDENKEKILEILGRTSEREKLQELRDKYQEMYGKDLLEDVKPYLDEDAQGVLQSLSSSAAEEDAKRLNEAIKGLGTDEDTIIEILCTRNNKELEAIREEYHKQFHRSLEDDLRGDTSGDVEKILVELSKGQREEAEGVDKNMAKRDAEDLMEAGVGSWGTDEGEFIRIFTQRSLPQLAAMYPEYRKLAKMDIEESIDKEMDGDLQKTFLALVKHSRNPSGAQADKITKAIKDGDTEAVARIILPMNKAQLEKLCSAYKKINKVDFADDIEKKCSGDLKQMLLAKLGKEAGGKKKDKEGKKDNQRKSKEGEKLPAIGKKKEQEKKSEKKQEKKSEPVKEEKDVSQKDIDELHQAIQDKNKDNIIAILSKNVNDDKKIQKLQDKYQKEYEQGLLDAIKSVVDDEDLQEPLECLFGSAPEYEAKCLYEATKGIGTDEDMLLEILCTRSASQLADIQEAYRKRYGTSLEEDIKSDTSGDFEDLLLELLKGSRDESDKVDKAQSKKDAEALYQAGAKTFGTNENTFISILTKRNPAQLNAVFVEYKKLAEVEIEESIENEMTGDLEKGLLILVKCMRNPRQFYSNKLHSSLQDGDTNTAARLILTSDKAKLTEIMNEYKKANDTSLDEDVQKKCSESLKKLLMGKIGKGKDSPQHKSNQVKGKDTVKADKGKSSPSKHAPPTKKQTEPAKGKKDDETSQLYKAVQAEDKKKIQDIVLRHATEKPKLKKLSDDYKKQHHQHLLEVLESNIDKDLLEAIAGLLLPPSQADARTLHSAMKGVGTNEAVLIEILCSRSNALAEVEIEESIENEMTGDLEKGLLILVKCMRNPRQFYSNKLHSSLQDGDTNTAARLILTSDKAKLTEIMNEYKKANDTSLDEDVQKKCSESLKKLLMGKIGKGKDSPQHKSNQVKGKDTVKADKGKSSPSKHAPPTKKQTEPAKGKKDDETSQLYKAVQAEDKKKIQDIVLRHATEKPKLKKLSDDYKKQHHQHLLEVLESNIDKDLLEAIAGLLLPPSQADARTLHSAMKGVGTNEAVLIEILCSRSNAEIQNIKKDYKKQYGKSLEEDVKSETSGDFEKLLVALLQGQRDESKSVNDDQAHKDAETLIEAGIKTWGTDEDKFIEIFTTRSIPQLQAMLPEYNKWAKCDIEESITSEMDGDLQTGLLTLVACLRDPEKNQVDKIHDALQDGDMSTVARIIAGSNEASLKKLESAYNANHKPNLFNEVDKKCSPELKKILLPKLKERNHEKTTNKTKAEPKKQTGAAPPKKKEEKDEDCTHLHTAIAKKDMKKIKEIVLRNAVDQNKLKKLSDDYQQRYNKDLVDVLDSKMEDDLHEAITALLLPPYQADARTLFYAMKGFGTKETLLIEILCTRNNEQIRDIKSEYMRKYGRSLEEDVKGDTSDDFEKLLTDLLKGARDESTEIDEELVQKDATDLYNAGVKIWGTHEDKFIEILTTRSSVHLKAMLDEYIKLSGVELEESIKDEMDGDLQDGLIMLLSCIQYESKAMADQLYTALQDHDTCTIARVIAATEQDKMTDIENAYNLHHRPKIYSEVNKKCSEDLKKIILPKLKDKKQEKEKLPHKAGARKQSIFVNKKQPSRNPAVNAHATNKEKGEDCSLLYRAIKNMEKKKITEIVVRNAADEIKMKKLYEDYSKRYKKNLVDELDSKIEDDVHEAITVLLLPPSQADARMLYYAMKGIGTHEIHLIEILCTKSNEEMIEIKKEYQKKYGRSLEEDVKYQTSGDFENLLTALMKGIRDDSTKVNQELARKDATALYIAGVKKWGTDEDKFIEILSTRNSVHLKAMMAEYIKLSGVELEESIKDEMDGDLQDGLIMLLSCIQDESKAMADQLYTALQDHDTCTVARIITATDQGKLSAVEASYNSTYELSLYNEVNNKCSDDLKKIILPKLEDENNKTKDKTNGKSRKISRGSQGKNSVKSNSNQSANSEGKIGEEKIEEEDETNEERPKLHVKKIEYHGTVVAAKDFDAVRDAERLKKAMKGFGSDEDAIISVLTACTSSQRQEIAATFKEQYGKDLVDELKSELSGKFEEAIVGLMSSPAVYDANMLYSAMKGIGTDDSLLTEIICSRTNEQIEEIKQAYNTVYGKDLIEEVQGETSGDFRSVLIALLQGKRGLSSDSVNEEDAYQDAQRLLEAGEKRWGTDESVFINILTTRSPMQLKAIFQAYKHVSNKEILEAIEEELEGDFHDAVRTIVLSTSDPPKYFAECLHSTMNGMMTNNAAVTRIIIARSEIDLIEIKLAYIELFGKTLESEVKDTFKGDQEGLLLKLLGEQ
ncbi:uncharacterized protein LOC116300181 [Actinia tenebrosa]|uniref:Annexin n=1 Tax=Actinia tenebrosa TaxID=6105 RepID=A0A6P8I9X9_ACTTE|nr:uncharacterized protein LOC116300181 [Actinia tenebrosa]